MVKARDEQAYQMPLKPLQMFLAQASGEPKLLLGIWEYVYTEIDGVLSTP
ncbi:hypothetical protein Aaci_1207 [Alicyclobacillus acidocaldarius subsp. acidocaldarius DSM 446]|uniref:Uncharacterized protein n=1 Tax=Alicyclobacillus acidocaldarius subsp. acidocaldarius (strain ATCC 27009 / DSM 446 / BCRC 14685 / JCM 5260 / KCTC 1825 / NBRC 15652 / NCIMB 11725 / NRRL B-14509 / 104-IA) TaxID=521098 RepID=C8WVW6_ALIAD|nr:hypothetical protein Aaci_1207 [Alicyclobacillus acidocaldarius subsp. acidocaldarius DSM 446]